MDEQKPIESSPNTGSEDGASPPQESATAKNSKLLAGAVVAVLLVVGLYAVARFLLEFLRGDEDRGFVFDHLLSTSQFIALLALAGIAVVAVWRHSHHRDEPGSGMEVGNKRSARAANVAVSKS